MKFVYISWFHAHILWKKFRNVSHNLVSYDAQIRTSPNKFLKHEKGSLVFESQLKFNCKFEFKTFCMRYRHKNMVMPKDLHFFGCFWYHFLLYYNRHEIMKCFQEALIAEGCSRQRWCLPWASLAAHGKHHLCRGLHGGSRQMCPLPWALWKAHGKKWGKSLNIFILNWKIIQK